jgi:hypothetical protein
VSQVLFKLKKLSKVLSLLGMSEAQTLKNLFKVATPLEAYVPIKKREPVNEDYEEKEKEVYNEETGEYEMVEKPPFEWNKVERPLGIKRDSRQRVYTSEEDDVANWFDSLKFLRDKIILIPFDWDDLDYGMISAIGRIFGTPYIDDYMELKRYISYLDGRDSYKEGNRDILKNIFPALWSDISSLLNSKGISEEDVVYVFYNQKNTPGRLEQFSKDDRYLSHDLFHLIADTEDSDEKFRLILNNCMFNVLKNYVNDDGKSADIEFDEDDFEVPIIAHEFFGPVKEVSYISGNNDVPADIFAAVTSGKIFIKVPDSIDTPDNYDFNLKDGSEGIVRAELEKCMKEMKGYVSGDEKNSSGPLSRLAGSVILHDL